MITRRKLFSLLGLSAIAGAANATTLNHMPSPDKENALDDWSKQVRYPVTTSHDPVIQQLLTSSPNQLPLAFYYFGGSTPRQLRLATIESVFTIDNSPHRYVTAYCHLRLQHRTFRTDRISLA